MDQLVIDQGGRKSKASVVGCVRLISQCLAMGKPWIMIHPQTQRLLLFRLAFMYSEEFSTSWLSFADEVLALEDKKSLALEDKDPVNTAIVAGAAPAKAETVKAAKAAPAKAQRVKA